jgi:hypothetical protein
MAYYRTVPPVKAICHELLKDDRVYLPDLEGLLGLSRAALLPVPGQASGAACYGPQGPRDRPWP